MPSDTNPIVAIADDLTGALETGAKFASHGLPATVLTAQETPVSTKTPVVVIDAETRHLSETDAGSRTRSVAIYARDLSPRLLFKKTDSTLRGNIAAELRAVQSVFPDAPLTYVPAYPDLGRTVKNGQLFVWGIPVHQTEFAADRWNPIRDCRVHSVLEGVSADVIDGESNRDIERAAQAILRQPNPVLCAGPAALAGALAAQLQPAAPLVMPVFQAGTCLVVNGSLHPVSAAQMKHAHQSGVFDERWLPMPDRASGAGKDRAIETGKLVRRKLESLGPELDTLIVFGGDTAFGIHRAFGSPPFESVAELLPGVPVSRCAGLLWITKAGGFGNSEILSEIRHRLR